MNLKEKRFKESDAYWKKEADRFSSLYSTKSWLLLPNRIFLKKRIIVILRYIKKEEGTVALDAGCGSGEFTNLLADYYDRVIGVDYSQTMIDKASQNCRSNVIYHKADCSGLPIKHDSIDYIFSMGLLDYVENVDKVIDEFVRVAKNKGKIVFTIPKTPSIFEPLRWSSAMRKKLFDMPPLVNVLSKKDLYLTAERHGIKILELSSLWTTMWIVYASVSK